MNSNKSAKCQTHYPYRRRCVVYGSIIRMCHIASMGAKNTWWPTCFITRVCHSTKFGETNELLVIKTEDWIPFIKEKFASRKLVISDEYAARICDYVGNHSSYVQQLAWNVMVETDREVDEESFAWGCTALLSQCHSYFLEQIKGMSSYQMNFIRILCSWFTKNFSSKAAQDLYSLGCDTVFQKWFTKEWM